MTTHLSWPRPATVRQSRQVASDAADLLARLDEEMHRHGTTAADSEARTVQAEAAAGHKDAQRQTHAVLSKVVDPMSWLWSLVEQLLRGGAPASWGNGKKRRKRT